MVVDVTEILACEVLELAAAEVYSDLYEIECDVRNWRNRAGLLWIARSGCDIPFDIQCILDEIIGDPPPDQEEEMVCGIVLTDIPPGPSCTNGIVLRTIK